MKMKTALSYIWKLSLCAMAFFTTMALYGVFMKRLGIRTSGLLSAVGPIPVIS